MQLPYAAILGKQGKARSDPRGCKSLDDMGNIWEAFKTNLQLSARQRSWVVCYGSPPSWRAWWNGSVCGYATPRRSFAIGGVERPLGRNDVPSGPTRIHQLFDSAFKAAEGSQLPSPERSKVLNQQSC